MITVYSCGQSKNTPVSVIFDTDIGPDYGDVGALTILHALADSGELNGSGNRHDKYSPAGTALIFGTKVSSLAGLDGRGGLPLRRLKPTVNKV
ncbi:hypothetical protein FACS189452_08990 [Bacteroidia bacterium]|nr:hypothetical protein FACS189452_08990 [Bacteroidia bacterium]GHT82025.1 hypothetical protein FACS189467_6930 [Bacteroidia bacterium]